MSLNNETKILLCYVVYGARHNTGESKDRKTEVFGKEMLHKYKYDNAHKEQ